MSAEEIIRNFGAFWDYEDCYKYDYLKSFDQMIQKSCELAAKAFEHEGEEAWFKLLRKLDKIQDEVPTKLRLEARKNPESLKALYKYNYGSDLNIIAALIQDFILRRKNSIVMK